MSGTLLFVDDDVDLREAFADLLIFAGWTVVQAADGAEAIACLATNAAPAIILLDLKMPGCGGYEFRRRQLADARWSDIPTVIFTADAHLDDMNIDQLGDVAVVRKSVEFGELRALLERRARHA